MVDLDILSSTPCRSGSYDGRRMAPTNHFAGRSPAIRAHVRAKGPLRVLLHMLCACALLLVASVHQLPARSGAVPTTIDLSDYMLPDGTLPVLCLSPDEEGAPGAAHRHGCDVCRIAATPELLAPVDTPARPADYRIVTSPRLVETSAPRAPVISRQRSRGPPGFHTQA